MPAVMLLNDDPMLPSKPPIPVCFWDGSMKALALPPSSQRDEQTALVVNNLARMKRSRKEKQGNLIIAVQVVSKTGLVLKGLEDSSVATMVKINLSDSDSFVVTDNSLTNVRKVPF